MESRSLSGKVAFITGSTRGIGWATARVLARHGATIILNGNSDRARLERRIDEIRKESGASCEGFCCDAADPAAVKACYAEIFRNHKRLDVLVNNAGILKDALLPMTSVALIQETLATNLAGAIYHLREASRLMTRGGGGSIVNLSSIIGRVGNEGQAVYGASKAALIGLTLSAAKELAPKDIRVNAVAPGFIDTDMTRSLRPDKFASRLASIRMNRIGTPEDVANTILFLASDLSSYVTGQVIGVDGGMLI